MKRVVVKDFITGNTHLKPGTLLDSDDPQCPLDQKLFFKKVDVLTELGFLQDPDAQPAQPAA